MPFKNPFFFSKKALGRIGKIEELERKEETSGPTPPTKVNNYHTSLKTTIGHSKNTHIPLKDIKRTEAKAEKVNNFEVNKPQMAKSLNQYPGEVVAPRDVQEVIPIVNGKVSPNLVHKPKVDKGQEFFPTMEKNEKKSQSRKKTGKTRRT